jgi:hypothetical protein
VGASVDGSARPAGRRVARSGRGLLLLAVATFCALGARPALAQTEEERARALFLEGAERYAAEDYEAAAESFAASHDLRPVPVVLFNLAQALRFMGRPGEALRAFRSYLESEESPGAQRRRAVEAAIGELESEVGQLQLAIAPEGVEGVRVSLDGRALEGVDVTRPFAVGPGAHRVTIRAQSSDPIERRVSVASGRTTVLRVHLARASTLALRSDAARARARLDGEDVGALPLELTVEPETPHELEVTAPGRQTHTREVELGPGQTLTLDVDLPPRHRLRDQWWLWATIGGVVLGALAVSLAVGLPQRDPDPLEGTLPTVQALSWEGAR